MSTTIDTRDAKEALTTIGATQLPDVTGIAESARRAISFIQSYDVTDDESFSLASEELRSIVARKKQLEEQRTTITGPINRGLRAINALFAGPMSLLETAESLWKNKLITYRQQQIRIADAARRKAEEEAAADRRRLEQEAAEYALRAQQKALEGIPEAAAELREQAEAASLAAAVTTAAPVAVAAPTAAGISTAAMLTFKLTDKAVFLAFVVNECQSRPELLDFVDVDVVRMRAAVRAMGKNLNFPGITVSDAAIMRVR